MTKSLCLYYQTLLDTQDIPSQILDLSELPEDFAFSALYENAGKNEKFNHFQKIIDQNERFVWVVPEYNASFPGVLKTFMDGMRYPDTLKQKKIALVGLSSGMQGGVFALSHLTDILHYLGAEVLSLKVKMPFIHQHFKENRIINELYNQLLQEQIGKLQNF